MIFSVCIILISLLLTQWSSASPSLSPTSWLSSSANTYMAEESWSQPQATCNCPPQKPIIKYIAVEVPKIIQVPSPAPPAIPTPPAVPRTKTKYIAIQEIHVPVSAPAPLPVPAPIPAPAPVPTGWN